jgi:hypothetical protein
MWAAAGCPAFEKAQISVRAALGAEACCPVSCPVAVGVAPLCAPRPLCSPGPLARPLPPFRSVPLRALRRRARPPSPCVVVFALPLGRSAVVGVVPPARCCLARSAAAAAARGAAVVPLLDAGQSASVRALGPNRAPREQPLGHNDSR